MKTMQKLFARAFPAIAILALLSAAFVANSEAQTQVGTSPLQQAMGVPWQVGGSWTFTSASTPTTGFNLRSISFYRVLYTPSTGFAGTCAISIDSAASVNSAGALASPVIGGVLSAATIGSCATPNGYVTTIAVAPTNFGQITPTITGAGSVTVTLLGYTDNPAAGGSIGGAVAVTNFPATQPVSGTVTSNAGTGNFNTQPSGFGAVLSGQQAVTASAVALPSNAAHGICVKALTANAIDIYVGPSGITISTGYQLSPGDFMCFQASNSNLISVIASATGASISWITI